MPAPKLCFPSELTPSFSIRQEGDAHTTVTWERMQFKSATQNNGKVVCLELNTNSNSTREEPLNSITFFILNFWHSVMTGKFTHQPHI